MSDSESEFSQQLENPKKKVTKTIAKKKTTSKTQKKTQNSKGKNSKSKNSKTASKKSTNKKQTTASKKKKNVNSDGEDDDEDDIRLEGQKHPVPDENDSLRVFYETLYQSNPNSLMAMKYCLEHGLIPENEIKEVSKKLAKAKNK